MPKACLFAVRVHGLSLAVEAILTCLAQARLTFTELALATRDDGGRRQKVVQRVIPLIRTEGTEMVISFVGRVTMAAAVVRSPSLNSQLPI